MHAPGFLAAGHRPALRAVLATSASTTLAILPNGLLGSLAVLMRDDLAAFDERGVGLAVGAFFASSAILSIVGGRLCERRGPRLGLVLGAVLSALGLLGLATAPGVGGVLASSVLAGVGNGIAQPAANLGITRAVPPGRQGLAFGIKQAAAPASGLLAGLAVPLLGLTLGWRTTFVLAGVAGGVAVLAVIPRHFGGPAAGRRQAAGGDISRRSMLMIAVAGCFGAASANSLSAFLVLSSVSAGLAPAVAGYVLAFGSVVGISSRIGVGWLADRLGRAHLPIIATMLAIGAAGYLVLAAGAVHPALVFAGTLLAFGAGWGWPGLLMFAVVRLNPDSPGNASGILSAGTASGAVLGPMSFGLVVTAASFTAAWLMSAGLAALAAVLVLLSRTVVRREQATRSSSVVTGQG